MTSADGSWSDLLSGRGGLVELRARGLVIESAASSDAGVVRWLTPQPDGIVARLVAERPDSLARRCEGWDPEQNPDLGRLLTGLAQDLVREPTHEITARA